MNKAEYFKVEYRSSGGDTGGDFMPQPNYYQYKNSWTQLEVNGANVGQACFNNQTCQDGLTCFVNPDTNQRACYKSPSNGFSKNVDSGDENVFNYNVDSLFTAICSERTRDGNTESYYPTYTGTDIISETYSDDFRFNCSTISFQQTALMDGVCYDADQLAGSKIVELCQAIQTDGNVCYDINGDKVYNPTLNPLHVLPKSTLCEDNTSINYITFNFNNVPQKPEYLFDNSKNPDIFSSNQLFCLSVDSINYYPDITINQFIVGRTTRYYASFTGTWGVGYNIVFDSDNNVTDITLENVTTLEFYNTDTRALFSSTGTDIEIMQRQLQIDIYSGINYKFPLIGISDNLITFDKVNYKVSMGNPVDVQKLSTSYRIDATITTKPCAIFDTSYTEETDTGTTLLSNADDYIDKQKFKIQRYKMDTGDLKPDPEGMISTITYRNLNYENGGLFLDYYVPPPKSSTINTKCPTYLDQNEGLILRKSYTNDQSKNSRWLLMKPMKLSPNTIPSGSAMWCNYCYDFSTDGGKSFNNGNPALGSLAPMFSKTVYQGQELIDPGYSNVTKQTTEKLFSYVGRITEYIADAAVIIGTVTAGGAAIYAVEGVADAAAAEAAASQMSTATGLLTGFDLYSLANRTSFHWQNYDPAFAKCAQLCSNKVYTVPDMKATVLNEGKLGGPPPGFAKNITKEYSKGDVIFGLKVGGITCQDFVIYNSNLQKSPNFDSIGPGGIAKSGEVEMVVSSVYDNTYQFDKPYFNTDTNIIVKEIKKISTGFGKTDVPQNVIISFNQDIQKFQQSFLSSSPPNTFDTCNGNNTSECVLRSELDVTQDTFCNSRYGIIPTIVDKMNGYDWIIDGNGIKYNMKLLFTPAYCQNFVSGTDPFYQLIFALPEFEAYDLSDSEHLRSSITINENMLATYFSSVTDPNTVEYKIKTENGETIFDTDDDQLKLDATYGNFVREYRVISPNNLFVGTAIFEADPNTNNPDNIQISVVNQEEILNNLDKEFKIQEWWVVNTGFMGNTVPVEYYNLSKTSDMTITLQQSSDSWAINTRAPRSLGRDNESMALPGPTSDSGDPINLLNNSVLQHGSSPQQIGYSGSFEETNQVCFSITDKDKCNSSELCSYDDDNKYCLGRSLIDFASENYGDIFTTTPEFTGDIFNTKQPNSHFTDLTFLKTLQMSKLNYSQFIPDNLVISDIDPFVVSITDTKDKIYGGDPTYYYSPPDFINMKRQGIPNDEGSYELQLGRFIPYRYFYPSFIDVSTGTETSTLNKIKGTDNQDMAPVSVNNFYINNNYAQFIPYGKKLVYENGFTKMSNAPTF